VLLKNIVQQIIVRQKFSWQANSKLYHSYLETILQVIQSLNADQKLFIKKVQTNRY